MKIDEIILGGYKKRRHRDPRKHRLVQPDNLYTVSGRDLNEAEGKNTHLDHAEELVFMHGTDGIKRVVNTFSNLLDQLDGQGGGEAVTTKWDGAPAIFCGKDPSDGKFFVGTKGVFAKNAKLNKSPQDIDVNHPDTKKGDEVVDKQGLRNKLHAAFNGLQDLGIEGVLQGDILFSKGDLKQVNIDGESYIAFKPNTITYVVPAGSDTAQRMQAAEIGVVFHTSYHGDSIENMQAQFGYDASELSQSPRVWFTDARINDVSGQVQMSKGEVAAIRNAIKELNSMAVDERAFKVLDAKLPINLVQELKAHANTPIRTGQALEQDADKFVKDFVQRLHDKFEADISKLKTGREGPAGQKKTQAHDELVKFIDTNAQNIANMYRAYLKTEAVKMMFQRKMRDIRAIDSFIEQPDGSFKVTDPEGFVIVDHMGRAMKIVDRLEFSAANFSPDKKFG